MACVNVIGWQAIRGGIAVLVLSVHQGVWAAEPVPTVRQLANQLRQQARLIEQMKAEIEQLRRSGKSGEATEASPQSADRPQGRVEPLPENVKSSGSAVPQESTDLREQVDALVARSDADKAQAESTVGKLLWSGYGAINYQRYDFFENAQDRTSERRAKTDLERFILAPRFDFGRGFSLHAEIEFEHGGTGSTVEFEPEEAGEFETEIEKGGEVVLEHAFLQIEQSPALNWRFGEVVVPFGMVNSHHQPSEYFTIERSLAETNLIPSVWHETGVELYGSIGRTRYQLQTVTALDSTGFNGYNFVRGGMQRSLEFRNATNLAYVARIDHALAPGMLIGAGLYYGDSSKNRPRRNLDDRANVTLTEVHGRFEKGPWIFRTQYLLGRIQNSDKVTAANFNTFNGDVLGVSRTPVGSRAESYFVEAGYDLFQAFHQGFKGRLDLFARYEGYDTHASTAGSIVRVARYDRKATTVGLNYKPQPGIVFKAEYSRRTNGGAIADRQNFAGLSVGFEF